LPIDVDREDVRRLAAAGAQLLEVLPREEYEDEHLPGAINIPLKELNGQTAVQLARDRPVVVYCNDYQ
jgi:rhodanese-related sulfurtransferase